MSNHVCAEHFHWHLNLQHFGNTNIKYLEVRGACKVCGKSALFRGPSGVNPLHPTVAMDGSEAIFPFICEGEVYDGNAAGYSVSSLAAN